ncbi:MAG: hypothetical protein ACRDJV_15005 [Actinomycetota bacterium]
MEVVSLETMATSWLRWWCWCLPRRRFGGSEAQQDRHQKLDLLVFGDWSREFEEPDGTLFVASLRKKGLWLMQELRVATEPSGRG